MQSWERKQQQQGLTKLKWKKRIWTPTSSEQDEKSRKCYKMLKKQKQKKPLREQRVSQDRREQTENN